MAELQAVLDEATFNGLEDSLKTFYTQNTETKQYYANVVNPDALAFNLQSTVKKKEDLLKKAQDAVRELSEKVKPYESLGKSAEELKQALESNRPEEISKLIEKYEGEKKTLQSSFDESIGEYKSKAEKYQKQALDMALRSKLAQVREQYDLNDTADFVLRSYYKAEETDDGQVVTRIYGEDGQPVLKAGQPITDEQFLSGLREQKKYLAMFNTPNGGGTGASNRQNYNSNSKTMKRADFDRLDPASQMAFIKGGGVPID